MSNVLIPLLAWKKGGGTALVPEDATPWVEYVPADFIEDITETDFGSSIIMKSGEEILVYEKPLEIKAAENPAAGNVHAGMQLDLGADAAGTAQGNGYDVTKYLTTIDAATDTSAEAVDLPAAVAYDVKVVVNETAVALEVFPASGETINGAAANAVYDQAANSKAIFYCVEDGAWEVLLVS